MENISTETELWIFWCFGRDKMETPPAIINLQFIVNAMKIEIDTILDRVCVCGELSLINNNLSWYANTKNLTAIWSATINRMENQTNERDGSWRTRGARQRFESNKDTRLLTLSLSIALCVAGLKIWKKD